MTSMDFDEKLIALTEKLEADGWLEEEDLDLTLEALYELRKIKRVMENTFVGINVKQAIEVDCRRCKEILQTGIMLAQLDLFYDWAKDHRCSI